MAAISSEDLAKNIMWAVEAGKRCTSRDGIYILEENSMERFVFETAPFPTIMKRGAFPYEIASTMAHFKERFYNLCPILEGFRLKESGIVIAGDAVAYGLIGLHQVDVDLYLITGVEAVKALLEFLAARYALGRVYRTKDMLVVTVPFGQNTIVLKLHLERYSSIAEILHSSDLGSAALAFDGVFVWMTALGILAIKYGLNVLNVSVWHADYEYNIVKSFNKGFGLVLPDLNTSELKGGCIELPVIFEGCEIRPGFPITSEYARLSTPRHIPHYTHPIDISLENLRCPSILGGRLVPGFNLLAMEPVFEDVGGTVIKYCNKKKIKPAKLERIFGDTAKMLITAVLDNTAEQMADILSAAIAERTKPFYIPFIIAERGEGAAMTHSGAMSHSGAMTPMTKEKWYGKYFRITF